MSHAPPGSRRPSRERGLLEAVAAELRRRGYRTYLDPDGTDYFDLAARRGDEVGLVEGKVAGPAEVLGQALRRRPWADWVSVVLGSERSARRLVERTDGHRAAVVGVWSFESGVLRELRLPGSRVGEGPELFAATRERLRRCLLDLDRGELPVGVRWSGVPSRARAASGGRGFGEWRLEELDPGQG